MGEGSNSGSMKRTIWFVLNQDGANDSEQLHERLVDLITSWDIVTSGSGGTVTYVANCHGEHFWELRKLFHDNEFIAVWGVILSGVMGGEQFKDWPKEPIQTPLSHPDVPKKTWFRTVWNFLQQKFGHKVIK